MWNIDNENILFSQCHIWFLLCSICSTQHSEILLSDIKARGVQWKRPGCPQRCSLEEKTKAGLKLHRRIQQSLIFFFRFITPFVILFHPPLLQSWVQIDDGGWKVRTCLGQDKSDSMFFWTEHLSGTSNQFLSLTTWNQKCFFNS